MTKLLEVVPDISDHWRLCDEFTVTQAALLIVGCDPGSEFGYCEKWEVHVRPKGYDAVKQALSAGLRRGLIKGENRGQRELPAGLFSAVQRGLRKGQQLDLPETDGEGNAFPERSGTTDPERSTVERASLVEWLRARGVENGFFFPEAAHSTDPGYLNPRHPRYAAPMAAAVKAWLAMEDENLLLRKSPKAAMTAWIQSRYKELGLFHEKDNLKNGTKAGGINKSAVERAATFANWLPGGGANKTPGG